MYQTHGIKYLGSKRRMLAQLAPIFKELKPRTALDVFTGTTRVAQVLRRMGVEVTTSDISDYSRVFSEAWVTGRHRIMHVDIMLQHIINSEADGWFTKTYCDVPGVKGGVVRFMTPENGRKVDGIRDAIDNLHSKGVFTDDEKSLLVASLMIAMDKVDNTVGVHQAYLKHWCDRAKNDLNFKVLRAHTGGPTGNHVTGNVLDVALPSADIAYIDPPYTIAAYGSNYHIWESMAKWDKPQVDLKTNRRIDLCKGRARTAWNKKKTAPDAFRQLFNRLDVGHIVLSYGGNSLISLEEVTDIVSETYDIENILEIEMNENIMSKIGGPDRKQTKRVECTVVARSRG